ncbi:MAG TPA: hypothetical protein VMZ91_13965 [Candidatus Paceibacterota bacterium]|nr:hypothetical protein [Candidatus Paceibacterota bacterium]
MVIEKTIESLKSVVSRVLKRNEESRNDDRILILEVLRELGFKIYIDYNYLSAMPQFESITRIRRDLQNNDRVYSPNEETIKRRERLNEESRGFWKNSNLSF